MVGGSVKNPVWFCTGLVIASLSVGYALGLNGQEQKIYYRIAGARVSIASTKADVMKQNILETGHWVGNGTEQIMGPFRGPVWIYVSVPSFKE
jgi:hypothetical protein